MGATVTIRNTDTNISTRSRPTRTATSPLWSCLPVPTRSLRSKSGFETYRESKLVLETGQQLQKRRRAESRLGERDGQRDGGRRAAQHGERRDQRRGRRPAGDPGRSAGRARFHRYRAAGSRSVAECAGRRRLGHVRQRRARRQHQLSYVDGFDDRNPRGADAQLRPNIDALEEFKMETSGFSAQYGNMAGGVMNMVLKSGTNQLHGTAFEYFRNDVFDARAFFDPYRLPLHRINSERTVYGPGGSFPSSTTATTGHSSCSVGRPTAMTEGQTKTWSMCPPALERAGNFSQDVEQLRQAHYDQNPFDNYSPFPGNIIPTESLRPRREKLMHVVSIAQLCGVAAMNYQSPPRLPSQLGQHSREDRSPVFRQRQHVGPLRLSLGARQCSVGRRQPWGISATINARQSLDGRRHLGAHVFSSLISEARAGFSRNAEREHIVCRLGQPTAAQLGMAGSTTDPMLAGFPKINVTNYATLGYTANEPVQYFVTDLPGRRRPHLDQGQARPEIRR